MSVLKTLKYSLGVGVLMLGFQNCGSKADFSATSESAQELEKIGKEDQIGPLTGGEFEAVSYTHRVCRGDVCASEVTQFKSKQTVSFSNGIVSGRAACNSFGGSYKLTIRPNEGTNLIQVKNMVSTLMACAQLKEEQLFLYGLSTAYKITDLSKNTVTIATSYTDKEKSEFGTISLRRKEVVVEPTSPLLGDYKVVSRPEVLCSTDMKCVTLTTKFKSDQRISFLKGGVVSGKAACNSFSGKFKFQDRPTEPTELLSFSGLVATQKSCADGADEQALLHGLTQVYKVVVSANQLELITSNGSITLAKMK